MTILVYWYVEFDGGYARGERESRCLGLGLGLRERRWNSPCFIYQPKLDEQNVEKGEKRRETKLKLPST